MYRMNTNRSMASRQRYDIDSHERMLSRRNMNCSSCNRCDNVPESLEHITSCGCGNYPSEEFDYSLAMVYPPEQLWQNLYLEDEGFKIGTVFKELDKPFYGPKCNGGACSE